MMVVQEMNVYSKPIGYTHVGDGQHVCGCQTLLSNNNYKKCGRANISNQSLASNVIQQNEDGCTETNIVAYARRAIYYKVYET